ncbi:M48 family metallopeptidase, partial [bacterium]|nr:M48 family metallopeptidase [bacterium]
HELGHYYLEHFSRLQEEDPARKIAEDIKEIATRESSLGSDPITQLLEASFRHVYHFSMEYKADAFALRLMDKAGYSVRGALKALQRIADFKLQARKAELRRIKNGGPSESEVNFPCAHIPAIFESHPPSTRRIQALYNLIQNGYFKNYDKELTHLDTTGIEELLSANKRNHPLRFFTSDSLEKESSFSLIRILKNKITTSRQADELLFAYLLAANNTHNEPLESEDFVLFGEFGDWSSSWRTNKAHYSSRFTEYMKGAQNIIATGKKLLAQEHAGLDATSKGLLEWLMFDSYLPTEKTIESLDKTLQSLNKSQTLLDLWNVLPFKTFYARTISSEEASDYSNLLSSFFLPAALAALYTNGAFKDMTQATEYIIKLNQQNHKHGNWYHARIIYPEDLLLALVPQIRTKTDAEQLLQGIFKVENELHGFNERALCLILYLQAKEQNILGKSLKDDVAFFKPVITQSSDWTILTKEIAHTHKNALAGKQLHQVFPIEWLNLEYVSAAKLKDCAKAIDLEHKTLTEQVSFAVNANYFFPGKSYQRMAERAELPVLKKTI